ncbi:ATP-binding protein [Streptomyces sp. NPDC006662]|uniref:ATP-binding protein n=1 Tax=Streptomyces sp. NPDC006662 TaxID=3156902 RepID=UPI00340520B7
MARRPLPRILTSGSTSLARGRDLARTAADNATDVLHPLLVIGRGLRVLAAAGRRKWAATPKDKRGPALFLGAACVLVVALVPYGPLTALLALMAAAGWHGRDRPPVKTGPSDAETDRLRSLYEALVPYFSAPEDPAPLFSHGGAFDDAFSDYAFDAAGRVSRLRIRYPAYFTDGEPASRARIEALLHAKSGRGREYLFDWDEEANRLEMSVLEALPTGIAAQPFVTSPGEYVLGFTDPSGVQRTLPVLEGEEPRDLPPVIWRTGPASAEPHLLAVGQPGAGTTTLLRSIALQALRQGGDVMIVEGGGSNEYACLAGRAGVLAVECGPTGALATVEWAAHETERRLIAAHRAREAGRPVPEDTRRPLWILLDRPSVLAHLATAEGRPDPLAQLQVPLRHGRAAHVTVVVAEHCDHLELIGDAVWQHTRARVFLGPAPVQQLTDVLGLPPHTTPAPQLPPGRGYARLGTGPVHRLQVPATPDPYDDATHPAHRHAVLELLPERQTAADGPGGGEAAPAPAGPLKDQPPAQGGAVGAEELPEIPAEAP